MSHQNNQQTSILVIGGDGYIGWPLSLKLAKENPKTQIVIADNLMRRRLVSKVNGESLTQISSPEARVSAYQQRYHSKNLKFCNIDACSPEALEKIIKTYRPETVYHLGHQPSAPYSMKSLSQCIETVQNNETSILNVLWNMRDHIPDSHLIKLGSFGVYAKSGIDIAEGYFSPSYKNKTAQRPTPYPRFAQDFYHTTKANDSNFIALACENWNLRVTDVMQSTVFGAATEETTTNENLSTRFDYDSNFGTVINRFLASMISGNPLNVYGTGNQRTGLMALPDCLSVLNKLKDLPTNPGEHRVINNVTERGYSINDLAEIISDFGNKWQLNPRIIRNQHNPRYENSDTKMDYEIETDFIKKLIKPTPLESILDQAIEVIMPLKDRVRSNLLKPTHSW